MPVTSRSRHCNALMIHRNRASDIQRLLMEFAQMVVQPDIRGVGSAYFFIKSNGLRGITSLFVFFGYGEK